MERGKSRALILCRMKNLQIEYIPASKLKPYEKNAKEHPKEQVEQIKESIKLFGMSDPIGIWGEDNIVVEGHGRLKACKELGIKKVPVIRLDHMSDEERRAYTIIHNSTTMGSGWDEDILLEELEDIVEIEMLDFGFDSVADIDVPKENERIRTDNAYNLKWNDNQRTEGWFQMPIIKADDWVPSDLIGFNYLLNTDRRDCGIHFYIDDYQFERIWNSPGVYIDRICEFEGALTPDFSLYMDMPMATKIWNVYRSRLIGQMMQDMGVHVIPTISWAEEETYKFAFDGIEEGSIVSVSTVGIKRSEEALEVFRSGCDAMIEKIKPSKIIQYGGKIDYDFQGIEVVDYENHVTEAMKK